MAAVASRLRARPFAASSEAAYFGYVNGTYKKMHCVVIYMPEVEVPAPMRLTIQ
jgi:hypothetical protein